MLSVEPLGLADRPRPWERVYAAFRFELLRNDVEAGKLLLEECLRLGPG